MRHLLFLAFLLIAIGSCTHEKNDLPVSSETQIWIGDPSAPERSDLAKLWIKDSDIDFYDSSARIFYLHQAPSPSLEEYEAFGSNIYTIFSEGEKVLQGSFMQPWMSFLPSNPIILTSFGRPEDILQIGAPFARKVDFTPCFYQQLKEEGKFHAGISCKIKKAVFESGKLTLNIRIQNHDQDALAILDPSRCGNPVFFWYCATPSIRGSDFYFSDYSQQLSDPGFKSSWFIVLNPGEFMDRQIQIGNYENIPQGEYILTFDFHGIYRNRSERNLHLYRSSTARIWMGEARSTYPLTIH